MASLIDVAGHTPESSTIMSRIAGASAYHDVDLQMCLVTGAPLRGATPMARPSSVFLRVETAPRRVVLELGPSAPAPGWMLGLAVGAARRFQRLPPPTTEAAGTAHHVVLADFARSAITVMRVNAVARRWRGIAMLAVPLAVAALVAVEARADKRREARRRRREELAAARAAVLARLAAASPDDGTVECGICLTDEAAATADPREWTHLRCGHLFHAECMRLWLRRSDRCPICRLAQPAVGNVAPPRWRRLLEFQKFREVAIICLLLPPQWRHRFLVSLLMRSVAFARAVRVMLTASRSLPPPGKVTPLVAAHTIAIPY